MIVINNRNADNITATIEVTNATLSILGFFIMLPLSCTLYTLIIVLCTTFVKHYFCTMYNIFLEIFVYAMYNHIERREYI